MKTVAVIFGGKSVEHDISVITGIGAIKSANLLYNVVPIYITKQGKWLTSDKFFDIGTFENFEEKGCYECFFSSNSNKLYIKKFMHTSAAGIDACLICLHGQNGEDGSIQGLLKTCGIPFSGCDVCSSAITFDKVICKDIFVANAIPTPSYVWFMADDFLQNAKDVFCKIKQLKYPVIVKPARLGSSVGIRICKNKKETKEAIEFAMHFDNKIIVEKALNNFREINVSVFRDDNRIKCSLTEEIINKNEMFTFDDKYIETNLERKIGEELDVDFLDKINKLSKQAYIACGCDGVVRIDFLVAKNGTIFLNEINSIPGLLSNHLWKKTGIGFSSLISKLVEKAIQNKKAQDSLSYVLNTKAIVEFSKIKNGKMNK